MLPAADPEIVPTRLDRLVVWWQPRCWSWVGAVVLVAAVVLAAKDRYSLASIVVALGLSCVSYGVVGLPARELSLRHRVLPSAFLVAGVVATHVVPQQDPDDSVPLVCVRDSSQAQTALLLTSTDERAVEAITYTYGDGTSYVHHRGDDTNAQRHRYGRPGTYRASVVVFDGQRAASASCEITVA